MDAFGHIKSVIAIILGLSIAKLLQGAVKFIQHPGRTRPYWVHLLWALYIFILLVHFWWWEYGLRALSQWLFQEYLFIIVFITLYFVLCALLFPDDLSDYQAKRSAAQTTERRTQFGRRLRAKPNEEEQGTPFRRSSEGSYAGYFYSRRKWFFGVLAASFVADMVDTAMKGKQSGRLLRVSPWLALAMLPPEWDEMGIPLPLLKFSVL